MHPDVSIKCSSETSETPVIPAIIAIGSNLGNRRQNLVDALNSLQDCGAATVLATSSLYRTKPVDTAGGEFLNAVVMIKTGLTPERLLDVIKTIELNLGRTGSKSDARPADLDILFFGQVICNSPGLTIPHPRWLTRCFVLVPLAEICELFQSLDSTTGRDRLIDPVSKLPLSEIVGRQIESLCGGRNSPADSDDLMIEDGPNWFMPNNVKI
jgi:2-amino-4-hydroxy-6-hydroxymethyldihydropteridine diphosphokinase